MGSDISVVIITKNEEQGIGDCLGRLQGWAEEIVVVDSHSDDRTVEICQRHGCRVLLREWPGSFADQKNFAIRQARCGWVFILDADEWVEDDLRDEVLTATRLSRDDRELVGFQIPTRNFFIHRYSLHAWAPDYHVRLIRNGRGIEYDRTSVVHEKLRCGDALLDNRRSNGALTRRLKHPIRHYSNTSFARILAKQNMYTTLEVEKLMLSGRSTNLILRFFRPGLCFLYYYVIKRGFLDGIHGWMVALTMFQYELAVFLKLWEYRAKQQKSPQDAGLSRLSQDPTADCHPAPIGGRG